MIRDASRDHLPGDPRMCPLCSQYVPLRASEVFAPHEQFAASHAAGSAPAERLESPGSSAFGRDGRGSQGRV